MAGAAGTVAELVSKVLGVPMPVGLVAWDHSRAGPTDGPQLVLRNRRALRRVLWSPGELGLARAYVTGDLDVDGDLADGLRRCWTMARSGRYHPARLGPRQWATALASVAKLGAIGPPPRPPAEEARMRGRLHSTRRDRSAISHHYDHGNEFYELLLDEQMAYSCGYWPVDPSGYTQEEAHWDKLELICRKLGLRPGMRLLDVGCGWGSLLLHAARHHDVQALGVTLSEQQAQFVRDRAKEQGLDHLVEVRLTDYRELDPDTVDGGPFDAVASIEMGEHVGEDNYPTYARILTSMLRPAGRLLLQQMSRGAVAPGGGAFIESYIAPDMTMRPLPATQAHLERAGLEIRDVHALREHYVHTVRAWAQTLERRWNEVVALSGEQYARVWRLYLAGGMLAFEENRMGVDQILAVRPTPDGRSDLSPREDLRRIT